MNGENNDYFGYLNGEFSELKKLKISAMDRGFIYGDGCYEVIPVYHKVPFLLKEHLNRLFQNLEKIRIPTNQTIDNLTTILEKLLSLSSLEFEYIYLQVTRGTYEKREHIFPKETQSSIFAYTMSFIPPTFETANKGIPAITRKDIRWDRCDIKSISLLGNVLLRQESQDANAGETILLRNDFVTEGSISNVFIVKSEAIITPLLNNHILPGITRKKVIEIAKELNLPCEERLITEDELRSADEIWLTSSTREIALVSTLDDVVILKSSLDSVWEKVFRSYQEKHG